ncbi:hypothetical protein [Prosthecobacter vanneervenii]|uniref:DUF1376 domain-containing protein n=1 Tax=Prosthecobacter vanneervenii TaxID=48466 RepID=A0A7W7Y8A6_9BACT|nr:hypothetical protein [Prosthecobacter vanneervenii]MBB5031477.1 hypothetical protein [Prosthecobacter vanneervenii]
MSTPTPMKNPPSLPQPPVRDAPAFDFYPERWLVGVAGMSDAEQLSYLRLLCHQWLLQGLPADVPALKRLGGKGVTPAVLAKLPLQPDGRRRNARLEIIREEQRERIAKKSAQRRAAAHKRWHGSATAPHTAGSAGAEPDAWPEHNPTETDAAGMRSQCGGRCGEAAADMPTTHRPPPTSVPEDANNAGAAAHESAIAGSMLSGSAVHASPAAAACAQAVAGSGFHTVSDAPTASRGHAAGSAPDEDEAVRHTPDLPTVLAWAGMIGCPPDKAEIWWHEHEARPLSRFGRWTDRDGNAVQRPQNALSAWWQKWQANDQQRATRLHAQPSTGYHATARSTTQRSDTANRPGRYA